MKVRFSITVRQGASLRHLIEAIPEAEWTPIPYWMDGAAAVAETAYTPFRSKPDAVPVRLIVRRVKPTPGSQLALFASIQLSRLHHRPGRRHPGSGRRPPPPRRDRERDPGPEVRRRAQPSPLGTLRRQRRLANGAWLSVQVLAHNLARWTGRIALGEAVATTKTLRRRFFSLAGRLTRSARRLILHLPQGWPWECQFNGALTRLRTLPLPS